jgi:hypothetical protein
VQIGPLARVVTNERQIIEVQEMNKRGDEKGKTQKPKLLPSKKYPGVHGKVVDCVEHKFEEGILHIDVRFTDKTALCWSLATAIVIREAHLSDWKTGDLKLLRRFVHNKSGCE